MLTEAQRDALLDRAPERKTPVQYRMYTVEIQAANDDGSIWQPLAPAEPVGALSDGETAEDVAVYVAGNQNVADGARWRVVVWEGEDADTGTEPAHILVASEWLQP